MLFRSSDLEAAWRELNDQRAEKVRDAMKHFWKAYRRFAFGYDELQPLSQMGRNNWGGVALWLMNLREEFEEAVEYVAEKVHFDSDKSISVFEFTIRILGGLLSAYHLSNDDRLLPRAIEAGNVVLSAFDGTHVLPHTHINLKTRDGTTEIGQTSLAEFGTISVEMRELSAVTGDRKSVV